MDWVQGQLANLNVDWQHLRGTAIAFLEWCGDLLSNPWARAIGLSIIVYATIRVIASVYTGDQQNSIIGPAGLRPHVARRHNRDTIVLPRSLMPMSMDGVAAHFTIFYEYVLADGKTRIRAPLYRSGNVRISVSVSNLPQTASTLYGYEVPDVATEDVCFPQVDLEQSPTQVPTTPDRAPAYAELHKLVEKWTEDDSAPIISLHADVLEEIAEARRAYITDRASEVRKAREANFVERWIKRGVAAKRPNVIGSYSVKLEFSHEPFFVLTRHPDRDLKMTAWLTVLTSMFALVMDAWPKEPSPHPHAGRGSPAQEQTVRIPPHGH